MPQGAKPIGSKILNLAEAKQTKNSIVQIENKDNLCCLKAVVVALTHPEENPSIITRYFQKMRLHKFEMEENYKTDLTTELCN